jgi:SAM-dependent methyltransferase
VIQKIILKAKYLTISDLLRAGFRIFIFKFLEIIYGFDEWHASSCYELRFYKQIVVNVLNKRVQKDDIVVEVGCGLGEIISRIKSNYKYGLDIDGNVIKAAAVLDRNINFIHGSLVDFNQDIDYLIAVNFLHKFNKKELYAFFSDFLAKNKILCLIADQTKYNSFIIDVLSDFNFVLEDAINDEVDYSREILVFSRH